MVPPRRGDIDLSPQCRYMAARTRQPRNGSLSAHTRRHPHNRNGRKARLERNHACPQRPFETASLGRSNAPRGQAWFLLDAEISTSPSPPVSQHGRTDATSTQRLPRQLTCRPRRRPHDRNGRSARLEGNGSCPQGLFERASLGRSNAPCGQEPFLLDAEISSSLHPPPNFAAWPH